MEFLTTKGVQVVAMVKDTVKADKVLPTENVTVVQGDVYQYADVQNAVMGVDAVVCASATNQFLDPFGPFTVDYTVRVLEPSGHICMLTSTASGLSPVCMHWWGGHTHPRY